MYRVMKQILNGEYKAPNGAEAISDKVTTMYTHVISWEEELPETLEKRVRSIKFSAKLLEQDVWRIEKWALENAEWQNLGTVRGSSKMSTKMALRMMEILETNEARKRRVSLYAEPVFEGYYKIEERKLMAGTHSTIQEHGEENLH